MSEAKREVWVAEDNGLPTGVCIHLENVTPEWRPKLVRYVPAESAQPAERAGEWVSATALPSWLPGLHWLQFDDGTIGERPAGRANGAWFYTPESREHAPVVAFCKAAPPQPKGKT